MKTDPTPRTLDEFGCWLNSWGWSDSEWETKRRHAYEEGIRDAYTVFNEIYSGWIIAWKDYIDRVESA